MKQNSSKSIANMNFRGKEQSREGRLEVRNLKKKFINEGHEFSA